MIMRPISIKKMVGAILAVIVFGGFIVGTPWMAWLGTQMAVSIISHQPDFGGFVVASSFSHASAFHSW
jgi:hypothetical protein